MNGFKRICAVVLGTVLFVAGMLKLMDPTGTTLIVEEYLKFFRMGFLSFGARALGLLLALVESLLGAAIITGVWRRVTAIASACLLGFFTIITLILWIVNPSMDCGCFGEALHLTHFQSFLKNVVLLVLWAMAFLPMAKLGEPQRVKYVSFAIAAVSVALFTLYSLLSLPMADFTPLKPGTELLGASEGDFGDVTAYIYEKDGREGAFTEDCPPDSGWTFVRTDTYDRDFIEEDAPQQMLSFCDASGEYVDTLALKGPVMAISSYDPSKLKPAALSSLAAFASEAEKAGFTVLFLTAGTPDTISETVTDPTLLADSYFADRRLLLTLNRSNGGVTYLCDGQVCAKWSGRALPSNEELDSILSSDPVEYMMEKTRKGKVRLQAVLLYTFAIMLLL